MRKLNRLIKNGSNRAGHVAVEFALVVPLVITLMLGGVELTRFMMIRHKIKNAAYEGSRTAMTTGATAAEATAAAEQLCQTVGIANSSVVIDPPTIDNSTSEVEVTVTINADENFWMLNLLQPDSQLIAKSTLKREQLDSIFQ